MCHQIEKNKGKKSPFAFDAALCADRILQNISHWIVPVPLDRRLIRCNNEFHCAGRKFESLGVHRSFFTWKTKSVQPDVTAETVLLIFIHFHLFVLVTTTGGWGLSVVPSCQKKCSLRGKKRIFISHECQWQVLLQETIVTCKECAMLEQYTSNTCNCSGDSSTLPAGVTRCTGATWPIVNPLPPAKQRPKAFNISEQRRLGKRLITQLCWKEQTTMQLVFLFFVPLQVHTCCLKWHLLMLSFWLKV